MYQYYNFLMFERSADVFNEIGNKDPQSQKKFDPETKSEYVSVKQTPMMIQAMGLSEDQKKDIHFSI